MHLFKLRSSHLYLKIIRRKTFDKRQMSQGFFAQQLPINQDMSEKPSVEAMTEYQEILNKYNSLNKSSVEGGGSRGIARHVETNKKILIRDRIKFIIDPGTPFFEIGGLAGFDMIYGDVPAAGNIQGIGKVCGVYCLIGGNDATVKGGTFFPITVTKSLRGQDIADENRLPCIYIPDSGGAYLPMQSEIFPDKKHGGRGFFNQAVMSSKGIHQVAVVAGSCTAGGAYTPTMCDEAIIVDKIGKIFLAGPPLVKAATGEVISDEDLGGGFLHSSVSGYTDYFAKDEHEAFQMCRDIIESLNMNKAEPKSCFVEPKQQNICWEELGAKEHLEKTEIYSILSAILDGSTFKEFKAFYGPGLITGTGYIEGMMVGIVANTDSILSAEAQKASHFMNLCNRRNTPLLFLQNSLPMTQQLSLDPSIESVVLKDRGKMCGTLSTATVPKIAITLSACYQDDYLLMCGPALNPNLHFMWPSSKMSSFDMTCTTDEDSAQIVTDAFYAAHNLLTDNILLPQSTRATVAECLRMLSQQYLNPIRSEQIRNPVFRM